MGTVRNKFDTFQEIYEKYDEEENFINAQLEALGKCILTKPDVKCTIPWKWLVRKKNKLLKKTLSLLKINPTNLKVLKLKKS